MTDNERLRNRALGIWALATVHKHTRKRVGHEGGACSRDTLFENVGNELRTLMECKDLSYRARLLGMKDADQWHEALGGMVDDLTPED